MDIERFAELAWLHTRGVMCTSVHDMSQIMHGVRSRLGVGGAWKLYTWRRGTHAQRITEFGQRLLMDKEPSLPRGAPRGGPGTEHCESLTWDLDRGIITVVLSTTSPQNLQRSGARATIDGRSLVHSMMLTELIAVIGTQQRPTDAEQSLINP